MILIILVGFAGSIVYFIGNIFITSNYISNFKLTVIKPLIEGLNQTFIYRPERKIPRFIFKKAKLFGMFNKYYGDDFVSGEIDGVKFTLSELSVFDERGSGDKKVVVKIFDGIFSEFDFNKNFSSTLLIYPDVAEKYFGHLGQWLQSINIRKEQLIKLDSPEFEKHFVVYGTDQVEARYLLTHSMMEYIVKLRERVNVPVYISFSESKLYIGFQYNGKEQFEPNINESLLDDFYIQKHIEKIIYHIQTIENFKLNKYLWSKQPKDETQSQSKEKVLETTVVKETTTTYQKQVKTVKDTYETFYQQSSEIMKSLETQRKKVSILKVLFTISTVAITIMLSIYINDNMHKDIEAITFVVLAAFFSILFGNAKIEEKYKDNYKTKLVSSLIKHINSELIYKKYNSLSQQDIYKALLFEDWSSFYGDDFLEGEISGLKFIGSELNIELENKRLFKGYFFIFDLEKYKNFNLRIFPKADEFDTQGIGTISLDNENMSRDTQFFNELFSVYSDNENSHKLLSQEFVSKLLFFYRELKVNKIFTSFEGSKVYLGFDFGDEDFFEGETSISVLDEDKLLFYITFFNAVEKLVNSILIATSKRN